MYKPSLQCFMDRAMQGEAWLNAPSCLSKWWLVTPKETSTNFYINSLTFDNPMQCHLLVVSLAIKPVLNRPSIL